MKSYKICVVSFGVGIKKSSDFYEFEFEILFDVEDKLNWLEDESDLSRNFSFLIKFLYRAELATWAGPPNTPAVITKATLVVGILVILFKAVAVAVAITPIADASPIWFTTGIIASFNKVLVESTIFSTDLSNMEIELFKSKLKFWVVLINLSLTNSSLEQ